MAQQVKLDKAGSLVKIPTNTWGKKQQPEGLLDPVSLARPIVEAHNGLGALGKALEGKHAKLHHAGQNGHGAHSNVPAVLQQTGVEADVQDALSKLHDKRRDAKGQTRQDHSPLQPDLAQL